MRELLQRGGADTALAALRERTERTPGSILYALEAQAWEQQGNWPEARRAANVGIDSAYQSGNRKLAITLWIRGARLDVRLSDFGAARQKLDEAEALVQGLGNDTLRLLEIDLNRLGIDRAEDKDPATVEPLRTKLHQQFKSLFDEQIAAQPALMGWLAVELAEQYPDVLTRIIHLTGLEPGQQVPLRALALALAAWDSQVSAETGEAPGVLARRVGVPDAGTLTDTWTTFVLHASSTELTQCVVSLLDAYPTAPLPVLRGLAEIFRRRALAVATPGTMDEIPTIEGASPRTPHDSSSQASAGTGRSESTAEYARTQLRLSGQQRQQLIDALLDAFPRRDVLAQMVRFRLDRNLEALVLSDDLRVTVLRLVEASQAEGWTAQLLTAAREARPDNARLFAFAQQFGLTSVVPAGREVERLMGVSGTVSGDVAAWRMRLGRLETQVCLIELGAHRPIGTGFLLGPDVLMTCYHVVESVIKGNASPQDVALRFDYKALADRRILNVGTVFRLATDWLLDYSTYGEADQGPRVPTVLPQPDELDYALLRVSGVPGSIPVGGERAELDAAPRGWIDIPAEVPDLAPGMPLFILQHTHGEPLRLAFDQEGVLGLNANGTRVRYKSSTDVGSSGAPCFNGRWELVAMHQKRFPEPRSGIEINEGVPLTAILRLLEMRGKRDSLGGTLP